MTDMEILTGPTAFSANRIEKLLARLRAIDASVSVAYGEFVHFLQLSKPLDGRERGIVRALLTYGPRRARPEIDGEPLAVVVPRFGTISPWSSKATDIFRLCHVESVVRVERGIRWYVDSAEPALTGALHDRMTETVVLDGDFRGMFSDPAPRPLRRIELDRDPVEALEGANGALGLALSRDEIEYLAAAFAERDRAPTDVELMMFAQANSEHCRHKIFNATWTVDGEERRDSLFQMIRNTYRSINGEGILSAYADNAAVIEGETADRFFPDPADGVYRRTREPAHILMKVETHNHPTAIAPHPGAATGSGGEIRDEGAVGRGSKPKAGLSGFTTSHLEIENDPQPWEIRVGKPDRIVSALEIMLEGPVGAAAFNNEFGRPALTGYFRTFQAPRAAGESWGYHKPVMIAGGLGSIRQAHVDAAEVPTGASLIVLGGPAMLIGLGGGAASSMGSGESSSDLDFASVQRENAEIQRRCQEVIDRCTALGEDNPIRLIHDVGAGGLSNAFPELVDDAGKGGRFDLRAVPNADRGMSPMEIWCNEAQERYVLAVAEADLVRFDAICRRERCPYAVVGIATDDRHLHVVDPELGEDAVDMALATLLGKPPKMNRAFAHRPRPRSPLVLGETLPDEVVTRVLRFPAVGSKKFLVTIGDRSITGFVARDQMVGRYQVPVADAAVTIAGYDTYAGETMAIGERAPIAVIDPAASARMAVAEALTNLAGVPVPGLSRVVLSANWMAAAGQGDEDQALHEAVHAVGIGLCPALGIAIPVGKDSLSMRTSWREEIERAVISPVTLNVTAFAPVTDVRAVVTPDLKSSGTNLLLLALSARARLGGSVLAQVYGQLGETAPDVDEPAALKALFELIQEWVRAGFVASLHDRSDGGLLVALLEMAFAGRKGLDVYATADWRSMLFNEEIGVVVEVDDERLDALRASVRDAGLVDALVARTRADEDVVILAADREIYRSTRAALESIWARTSYLMQRMRDDTGCADEEYAGIEAGGDGLVAALGFDPAHDAAAPYVNVGVRPRVAVLRDQGVNGQIEMAAAFDRAGFDAVDVHMSDLFAHAISLDAFDVLAACGGFSYGDVLGGGGGWAKSILFDDDVRGQFSRFYARDALALGICNGCQMMSQLKELIPGADSWPRFVRNRSEQFEGRTVQVMINDVASPWLAGMAGSRIPVPVAHGEGRVEFDAGRSIRDVVDGGMLAMQYVDGTGAPTARYPHNPNGSELGLAGVTSSTGSVLIMMPHPERVFRTVQNSFVAGAAAVDDSDDGPWLRLFRNARVALG